MSGPTSFPGSSFEVESGPWERGDEQATSMTSNGKKFTVTREMLTAVAHDQSRGGLMSSLESQHVFQNLLLFCFVCNKSLNDWSLGEQ